jgi:hypothetical protein
MLAPALGIATKWSVKFVSFLPKLPERNIGIPEPAKREPKQRNRWIQRPTLRESERGHEPTHPE